MSVVRDSVRIPAAGVELEADVVVPPSAAGVVGFVHGSGSSRHSPFNRYVAAELQAAGLATVLADLLTPVEEVVDARTAELRFDIDLLAARTRDPVVLQLNQEAMTQLVGATRLAIVPGASHLFPEPGALEEVARLATAWFVRHLQSRAPRPPR